MVRIDRYSVNIAFLLTNRGLIQMIILSQVVRGIVYSILLHNDSFSLLLVCRCQSQSSTVISFYRLILLSLQDTGNRFRYNYLFYAVNISQILYTLQRLMNGRKKETNLFHFRTLFTGVKYLINVEKDSFTKSLLDYDYFEETCTLPLHFNP